VRTDTALGSLDCRFVPADNGFVARKKGIRAQVIDGIAAAVCLVVLVGCSGVSGAGSQSSGSSPSSPTSGQLAVTPATLSFGNVAVGSSSSLTGTLTASNAAVTVSSADWNGSGYALSGISFPVTISAGKSLQYTVTFDPQSAGNASGNVSFISNASNSPAAQSFSGDGTQSASQHTVSLSWDPSTSTVIGYNVYRGTQSGGPYSKVNSSLQSGTTYMDSTVTSGTTYYYVATSVDANQVESAYSNQAVAQVPSQ